MSKPKETISGEELKNEILKILPPHNGGNKGGKTVAVITRDLKKTFSVKEKEVRTAVKKMTYDGSISNYCNPKFIYYTRNPQ